MCETCKAGLLNPQEEPTMFDKEEVDAMQQDIIDTLNSRVATAILDGVDTPEKEVRVTCMALARDLLESDLNDDTQDLLADWPAARDFITYVLSAEQHRQEQEAENAAVDKIVRDILDNLYAQGKGATHE